MYSGAESAVYRVTAGAAAPADHTSPLEVGAESALQEEVNAGAAG